jgi:hypothetical protein
MLPVTDSVRVWKFVVNCDVTVKSAFLTEGGSRISHCWR